MKQLAFIITITFLFSCSSKKENNLDTHKVIFLTSYFQEYATAAKHLDQKGKDSCLRKLRELMFIRYFTKCEITEPFNVKATDTSLYIESIPALEKTIQLINSNKDLITSKIDSALVKCYGHLHWDSVNVYILPSRFRAKKQTHEYGISGFTPGSHDILLFLDPSFPQWKDLIEINLAHEFHHTYWIKHNNASYHNTLLEWMICEGKAETFAHLVYPDVREPWDSLMTPKQKKEIWDSIKTKLKSTDNKLGENFMFGRGGYPFACGYTIGKDIVISALKKNPVEPKYWTNFSADFILKESGYK